MAPGRRGFTLIELLLVVVIIGLLAALAMPNFTRVMERARNARAMGDIHTLQQAIAEYWIQSGAYPEILGDIDLGEMLDPWGAPYRYLPITGKGKGGFRKDKFLVPLNSDYDLYSMGPDGQSSAPLNAKQSQDDIIRANDGGFVGVAVDF